jgi:transposase-like protein
MQRCRVNFLRNLQASIHWGDQAMIAVVVLTIYYPSHSCRISPAEARILPSDASTPAKGG